MKTSWVSQLRWEIWMIGNCVLQLPKASEFHDSGSKMNENDQVAVLMIKQPKPIAVYLLCLGRQNEVILAPWIACLHTHPFESTLNKEAKTKHRKLHSHVEAQLCKPRQSASAQRVRHFCRWLSIHQEWTEPMWLKLYAIVDSSHLNELCECSSNDPFAESSQVTLRAQSKVASLPQVSNFWRKKSTLAFQAGLKSSYQRGATAILICSLGFSN